MSRIGDGIDQNSCFIFTIEDESKGLNMKRDSEKIASIGGWDTLDGGNISAIIMMFRIAHAPVNPALKRILENGELVICTAAIMPPLNIKNKADQVIDYEADLAKEYYRNNFPI